MTNRERRRYTPIVYFKEGLWLREREDIDARKAARPMHKRYTRELERRLSTPRYVIRGAAR